MFLAMIREYRDSIEFHPLRESDPVEVHQITVCIRRRPLNKKELARSEVAVISRLSYMNPNSKWTSRSS
jgi:kinesin family protein 2/24